MKNYEDYKIAVLNCIQSKGNHTEIGIALDQAKRSELKRLLQQRITSNLSTDDRHFICLNLKIDDREVSKSLSNVSAEAFRNVENFIKQETRDPSSSDVVELAAILIDYPYRPYANFRSNEVNCSSTVPLKEVEKSIKDDVVKDNTPASEIEPKVQLKSKRIIAYAIAGILLLVGSVWGVYLLKIPNYMQWHDDHYELVENTQEPGAGSTPILAYDAEEIQQQKVNLKDCTVFFKDGKHLYFYAKVNGHPEFFTQDGNHPAYPDKELHRITPYIIKKYLKKKP
jgi:hypothetical protein